MVVNELEGDVFNKYVYVEKERFGVSGARENELGVIGGVGFDESILVFLQIVCIC